jgi:predicted metal-dependent peptidase
VVPQDGKARPYEHQIMNVAMDYVINDMLIEGKVGEYSSDWLHDKNMGTANDSVVDVYGKIFKQSKAGGFSPKGTGFDQHLAPGTSQGKDPTQASQQRNSQTAAWQTAVAAAAAAAKAQGKLPAGIARVFEQVLDPKVDWQDKIAALFARKIGSGSFDWRRPDRRLIVRDCYAPGRSGFGAGTVAVGIDTSGSIGPAVLDRFMAEMAGILEEVKPKRLLLLWCDAKMHRMDEAEDAQDLNVIRAKGAPGGGGTSFVPVFDELDEMNLDLDALVYLTDGLGTFPAKAPKYPVIWGSISAPNSIKYPFGDVVDIPAS